MAIVMLQYRCEFLTSRSDLGIHSCVYDVYFDPSLPEWKKIDCNDDSSNKTYQFEINKYLLSGFTYVFTVTTYKVCETGSYSINIYGPAVALLDYIQPSTSRP